MRLTQLLARYLALGLIWLLGHIGISAGEGDVTPIAEPIAAGVGALVLLLADHLLHRKQAIDRGG